MVAPVSRYRFGPFELNPRVRELRKSGTRLKLRPQPFEVLVVLLEHGGEVVSREGLRQRVWQTDTFVDFEHGLNTAIKELRSALSDSAADPRYVETIPRAGYRILVPVEVELMTPPTANETAGAAATASTTSATARTWMGAERRQPAARRG